MPIVTPRSEGNAEWRAVAVASGHLRRWLRSGQRRRAGNHLRRRVPRERQVRGWPRASHFGTTLTIRNGRIAAVGKTIPLAPDARTIDLGGRTVVPGLFDGHAHYTRAGVNPGYEARRIERAFSIAELQEAIAERAKSVPLQASSSHVSAAGTTPSSARDAGPRRRSRRSGVQAWRLHFRHGGGGQGATTNSASRFSSRRASRSRPGRARSRHGRPRRSPGDPDARRQTARDGRSECGMPTASD